MSNGHSTHRGSRPYIIGVILAAFAACRPAEERVIAESGAADSGTADSTGRYVAPPAIERAQQTLVASVQEHAAAVMRMDAAAAASLFADRVRYMPANHPDVIGRDSVEAFFRRDWARARPTAFRLTTRELYNVEDPQRNFAIEFGDYELTSQQPGQAAVQDKGRYTAMWRRRGAGWEMVHYMANSTMPPAR